LYDTDREVDGVKVNAIQTEQEEMHMVLLKMDQLADLANVEDNVELVEPMTAQVLRQYEMQSQCLVHRYDTVNPDIFDLLCTDMEVDEHSSQTKAMKTNEALLQVDQMVDQTVGILQSHNYDLPSMVCTSDRKAQFDVSVLQFDLQFDEEIDNRMKVLRDMGTQQKKSRHTIPANVPDSIADLYATDLQIDGCSSLALENTNIDAILDLYDTDREVDGVKVNAIQTEQEEMHMVLLKMDQLADLANVEDNVELVEPMTAQVLRQYEMQSQCLVHRYDTVNPDIFDLLCTDMEVDEHSSQTKAMKTNEALLQVDQMVDHTVSVVNLCDNISDVRDLFIVDQEVDNLRGGYKKGTIKEDTKNQSEKTAGMLLSTRNLRLPSVIVDLYITDLEADGTSTLTKETDDMKTIMSLHEVDIQIDAVNHSATAISHVFESVEAEKVTRALLRADQLVDRKHIDKHADFVDQSKGQIIQAIVLADYSNRSAPEILDLLSTDQEVHKFGMNCETIDVIKPLLDVDREIDIAELSSQWRKSVSEVIQFLNTDIECASKDTLWKGPALELISNCNASNKQVLLSKKVTQSNNMCVPQNKELYINGLTAMELSTTEKDIDDAKQNNTRESSNDVNAEYLEPRQKILRVPSRSIFSIKEKAAARRHSFVERSLEPALLQTASGMNTREAVSRVVVKGADISNKETKVEHSEIVPKSVIQDTVFSRRNSLPINSTQKNVRIEQTSSRRSIFSNKEKFSARQKGQHWL